MINKSIEFASLCHNNQYRKGTKIPYILHPLEAGVIASKLTLAGGEVDEDIVASSILHDVPEDSKVSISSLEITFNSR